MQHDGYAASGLKPEQVSLQAVRTEELFGLVFVCLDDAVEPLVDFLGSEIVEELRGPFADAEFEVFHLHRAELAANWKLFVKTNAEGYHELLHLLNRTTAVGVKEYRNRRWHVHRNGHLVFEHAAIGYDRLDLGARDENLLPGMLPNGHLVVDLFPDMMLNCRSTVLRIDSLTPIAPGRTLLECRGLGLKGDPPDVRRQRVAQHNQVWGPMGRNLPEDIWAVETQWRNMASGASAFSMIAREENLGPMDDATLRYATRVLRRMAAQNWPPAARHRCATCVTATAGLGRVSDRRVSRDAALAGARLGTLSRRLRLSVVCRPVRRVRQLPGGS